MMRLHPFGAGYGTTHLLAPALKLMGKPPGNPGSLEVEMSPHAGCAESAGPFPCPVSPKPTQQREGAEHTLPFSGAQGAASSPQSKSLPQLPLHPCLVLAPALSVSLADAPGETVRPVRAPEHILWTMILIRSALKASSPWRSTESSPCRLLGCRTGWLWSWLVKVLSSRQRSLYITPHWG